MGQTYDIYKESKEFACQVIGCYKFLVAQNEYVMSKQLLRSGTSIGANVHEGKYAGTKKDFIHKMNIALKEASETDYRLGLLEINGYIEGYEGWSSLREKAHEMIAVLIKIIKTSKKNMA